MATGEVKGKYGYVDETGKVRVVEYGANKYGFQPSGEGITVAPPTLVDETTDKNGLQINDYDEEPQQKQYVTITNRNWIHLIVLMLSQYFRFHDHNRNNNLVHNTNHAHNRNTFNMTKKNNNHNFDHNFLVRHQLVLKFRAHNPLM